VDRRQFIERLSAACLAAGVNFPSSFGVVNSAAALGASTERASTKPILIPIPASVGDLHKPALGLIGTWLFAPLPPDEFWKQEFDLSKWSQIAVPNELEMLGFQISPDVEYPCRKTIQIPSEFANHRIFIRFDGVYSYARVWVNGAFVRDHSGGFTSWDAEITEHVQPGTSAELVVGITDQSDSISQGSYYAKHPIGGIIRNVRMFAVPKTHLSDLAVMASFDDNRDGAISLKATLSSPETTSAELRFTLRDPSGKLVALAPASEPIIFAENSLVHELRVRSPSPWDSEHPNLYRFQIALVVNGQVIETVERTVGFRSVARIGNQLFVNGQPVKLYGACRHSIHPIYGRAVPPEFDEKDAILFREANINFVRTSHYPPTETFLEACDLHGIYIEEETAVCWSRASSSNPDLQEQFLAQFREMITRDRHHACVLFWSLGNESNWGPNIAAEKRYAEEHDPSRPTIFSYPDTMPMGNKTYDIYSKHYPDVHSDLDSPDYPLLNDEFAHISCYNLDTLRRDPGVRNFWGESIKQFGEKLLAANGCLGGSIWAGIDDVFLLPSGPVGYGEWGIIDGWRRRKPEHWLTRKAYSPIRIDERSSLPIPEPGNPLSIPIRNAFNHTNLKEVDIEWAVHPESGRLQPIDIAPHGSGALQIPPRRWQSGEKLQLEFRAKGALVEHMELLVGTAPPAARHSISGDVSLKERVNDYLVSGSRFSVVISKQTGLITEGFWNQQSILQGGPFLDLGSGAITSWMLTKTEVKVVDNRVLIFTSGEGKAVEGISAIPIQFEIEITGAGLITTRYRAEVKSTEYPNLGISYLLPNSFDKLAWKRKALWSRYPDDHIGRPEGVAMREANHPMPTYREEPAWPWSQDMGDYFLWGKSGFNAGATNDFRSLRPNIWWASLSSRDGKARIHTEADADAAVRASVLPNAVCFSVYNYWSYPDLDWGNYTGPGSPPAVTTLQTQMWLTDQSGEES
jgi:hypothetical protein